ncbi:MAG: PAS domain S-box protein [Holophaga sp.]|nr:PAS domain S-box protein [Holophaga sp.]
MSIQPTRILIVEDEAAHAEAIARSLESIGNLDVRWMRTLGEFREHVEGWQPDIALMDLNLPDGRATEALPDPDDIRTFPVIVMTSYGSEQAAVDSMKSGAWDYLVKSPEAFRTLPKTIERVLREWGLHTKGRRLHRELQASEANLRAITEGSLDVIYTLDAQGIFLFMSPAWERHFGTPISVVLGKPFAPFVHPEDHDLCLECLTRVLATGQSETSPAFRVRRADGAWRWFQANASRMITPEGEQRFVGVAHDITDRKQREDEREASLLSLRSLASIDRIIRQAGVTNLKSMNEAILEALLSIFGCDRAWLIFPADPEAPAYSVPMERTRPEYPGGGASGRLMPMSDDLRKLIGTVLASEHPVSYGSLGDHPVPQGIAEALAVQSQLVLPIVPTQGKPWLLGLHQCSYARAWSEDEKILFTQIGARAAAGLNTQLFMEELQASQAQTEANRHLLRLMADNVPDLIWAKDLGGRYLFVNQAMCDTLLQARDTNEPVGKTDLFFAERERAAHPERPDWHTFGELCQSTDAPVLASLTAQRFDEAGNVRGEMLFLDVYKAPFLDEQNRLLGTVGSARVVTREKQIEAELQRQTDVLRQSEAQNLALIAAIPDLIFTNRRDGEYLDVRASDPRLLLVSQKDFLHRRPQDFLPNPLAEQFLKAYEGALDSQVVQEIEYSLTLGGEERAFEARVAPCTQDTAITIVRDVTERNRAAAALRSSQDLLAKAFAVSPDAFAITTLEDGVYLEINEGFTRVTGYSKEDVVGRSAVAELNPLWADANDRKNLVAGLKEKGEVLDFEATFLAKGGRPFFGLMSARLFEINGKQHVLSITRDITERKRLKAQLVQAQKMESLGTLAGGVAHDMNNVLGAILGMATAHIDSQPVNSPIFRAFDTIIQASTRGGKMVKSLLNFARHSPAEEHELDMNTLVREEVNLLERTTLAKVRLKLDLAEDLRPMRGDASALTHALMNLCVNAVDAMPENGTLTLRTRNVDNDWIEVVVADTGTGMPPEVMEKAMDPFYTTKDVGKGTGLGLSMVYGTVKVHQGQMEIQSELGLGTRVMLRFPASSALALEPVLVAGPASGVESPTLTPARVLKVLVVDDDELILGSLLEILKVLGHSPRGASCGEEALAELDAGFQPDVVILDMNMPGLGGAGTLPRLRALRPTTPVLLATGRVDQFASDLAEAHPYVTLLSKPFSMKELQEHLALFASNPAPERNR